MQTKANAPESTESTNHSNCQVARRLFLTGVAGLATATVITSESRAQNVTSTSTDLVDVKVSIVWNNNSPVVGARVYHHLPNILLGETNKEGLFFFTAENGTIIRLVEPKYGLQQSLFRINGKPRLADSKIPGSNNLLTSVGEGWTIN